MMFKISILDGQHMMPQISSLDGQIDVISGQVNGEHQMMVWICDFFTHIVCKITMLGDVHMRVA